MDIRKLQRVIVDALDDIKAHDIKVFNTSDQTGMFDRVILATGTSNRQTRALANHVREKAKAAGGHVISTEGEDTGEWVLVDLGDAVVHIMQPAIRGYYNLEEIWGAKPVRLKLNGATEASASGSGSRTRAADPDEKAPRKPRSLRDAQVEKDGLDSPPRSSRARKAKAETTGASANVASAGRPTGAPAESESATAVRPVERRVARKARAG